MNWRCKAILQSVLSTAPAGERLHYLVQRHVTHSVAPSQARFEQQLASAGRHIDRLRACGQRLEGATFYEFGAGWSLVGPLALYALGVDTQVVIDVRPLARRELVDDAIARFASPEAGARLRRTPPLIPPGADWLAFLRDAVGVEYRAPCDARSTGLPAASVDCVTSTATLEHVPAAELVAILVECYRLLRPGSLMSHFIDYKDHYAQVDRRISRYNFLRYSDDAWRRYSPALHFQSRLRHPDYLELFARAGFEFVEVSTQGGTDTDLATLRDVPLDARFRRYEPRALAIQSARIVVRKPVREDRPQPGASPPAAEPPVTPEATTRYTL